MVSSELLKEFGFEEEVREILSTTTTGGEHDKTGFPKAVKTHRMSLEAYDMSLEEPYFWILDQMREGFPIIDKVEDAFAASENSAFFGVTQQKLGAQQDKISQFLATTGKMVKELFQMIREMRIIDERLGYYKDSDAQKSKPVYERGRSAEITLKGLFVDLVQGGGKSAASVYGMARELEFLTLPDLFFDAPPFKNVQELEAHVKNLKKDFNENVLRVLMRHLRQFMQWKNSTFNEHKNRKRFMLNYLEQHFQIVNMYLTWVKPYLRHVQKLTLKSSNMGSPDLISAFEGSMLDVEILCRKRVAVGKSGANGVVVATFNYRTRPELKVVQEGYQRGPVHIGKIMINYRVYGWTDEQVAKYKKMKEKETLMLFGNVSASVQEAMSALGDDLTIYLEQARSQRTRNPVIDEKKEVKAKPKKSITEKLLGDFYTPSHKKSKEPKVDKKMVQKEMADAIKAKGMLFNSKGEPQGLTKYAMSMCWPAYHNFKKSQRLITW